MAVTSFTQPGDAVIIQPPVYYPFRMMIEDNGRKMVTSPLLYDGGRYTMDYEGFERELENRREAVHPVQSAQSRGARVDRR